MKAIVLAGSLALSIFTSEATAVGRPNPIFVRFFEAAQGHWVGRGTSTELVNATQSRTFRLNADVFVTRSSSTIFGIQSNLTTDAGAVNVLGLSYEIRGNDLFVSAAGPLYPVHVTSSSANSVSYRFAGAPAFGSAFEITHHLSVSSGSLRVHAVEKANGIVTKDQSYTLRRF